MTEANLPPTLYLTEELVAELHAELSRFAEASGEPIPPYDPNTKRHDIDALVSAPRQMFYGNAAYPSLEEKAAITFYTVNKKQIFLNGNKRMSTLCLLVFLGMNGKTLNVSPDALTEKALWLANTDAAQFEGIKHELVRWIRNHLVEVLK